MGAIPIVGVGGALLGVCALGPVWLPLAYNNPVAYNRLPAILSLAQNGQRARIHLCTVWGHLCTVWGYSVQPMLSQKTCFTKTVYENQ